MAELLRDGRALLISALLVSFVVFSYWTGSAYSHYQPIAAGTTPVIDDAALSSKIKAKMVLDDYVKRARLR
jgi:hypothetical protein